MAGAVAEQELAGRIADGLYTEALLLADEMRAYFDEQGRGERDALDPRGRVQFACESLKATTRLMSVIAWLTAQRGADPREAELGAAPGSEPRVLGRMPSSARKLILAGIDLHERVGRLASGTEAPIALGSPARVLIQRLERAF